MRISLKISLCTLALSVASCSHSGWTREELSLIGQEDSVMRVLTVASREDSLFLRKECLPFSEKMLSSKEYAALAAMMVSTVTSPGQDGVGIAGPQVGISRRIVAVQRFDKEGEPFEVYPNVCITAKRGEKVPGPEGCLSVPCRRDSVLRWRDIEITYCSPLSLKDTSERITGFTAVIFQHECDHLDGILYTDHVKK